MEAVTLQGSNEVTSHAFFFFFFGHCFFPIQTVSYCAVLKQLLLNINTFWHFKSATCTELSAAPKQLFFKLNAEKSNHCVHSSSSHVKFVVLLFLLNLSYARSFAVPLLPTFVIPWLSMAAEPSVPFSNQPAHPHPRSKRWRTMVAVRFLAECLVTLYTDIHPSICAFEFTVWRPSTSLHLLCSWF